MEKIYGFIKCCKSRFTWDDIRLENVRAHSLGLSGGGGGGIQKRMAG